MKPGQPACWWINAIISAEYAVNVGVYRRKRKGNDLGKHTGLSRGTVLRTGATGVLQELRLLCDAHIHTGVKVGKTHRPRHPVAATGEPVVVQVDVGHLGLQEERRFKDSANQGTWLLRTTGPVSPRDH